MKSEIMKEQQENTVRLFEERNGVAFSEELLNEEPESVEQSEWGE